jgi:hypothetical protein
MEQLGSHWMDFLDTVYLSIFRNSAEKIQVSLKSHKKKGYMTALNEGFPCFFLSSKANAKVKPAKPGQDPHSS